MNTLMRFDKDGYSLQFQAGGDYPAKRVASLSQVLDRTAAGSVQVEDLGIDTFTRVIVFNLMPQEDYEALLNWFLNIVRGSKESFQYTDEYGDVFTARIISPILDFDETSYRNWSGELVLEYL